MTEDLKQLTLSLYRDINPTMLRETICTALSELPRPVEWGQHLEEMGIVERLARLMVEALSRVADLGLDPWLFDIGMFHADGSNRPKTAGRMALGDVHAYPEVCSAFGVPAVQIEVGGPVTGPGHRYYVTTWEGPRELTAPPAGYSVLPVWSPPSVALAVATLREAMDTSPEIIEQQLLAAGYSQVSVNNEAWMAHIGERVKAVVRASRPNATSCRLRLAAGEWTTRNV